MKGLVVWCRKHDKAYVVIIYVIGLALGFGFGYQACLHLHSWQSMVISICALW